ncbi:MAG: alpha/beta hydrolase [Alphaproteobacteria bacterium]|jgi:pimeloyl-ACP methyl ester carboxylesterase|nr:alpha/beta hydrolase [Alphaproteobacteria bacterium]
MITTRKIATRAAEVNVLSGGTGPDLLFLHNAGGVTAENPFLLALAKKYRVFAPQLPGYGDSGDSDNIRDMLDVTLHSFDVLEALGLEKPLLVGHSLGGMIAAEMAALRPREVEKLCLIASAGLWLDAYPVPDIFTLLPREFPAYMFHDAEAGAKIMATGGNMNDPAFLIPFLVTNARQLGMAGKFLFPIPDRGLKERIHRIRARTILVWGDSDRIFPAPYAQAFKSLVPGAELVSIPDAGHQVVLEQTNAVMAAIGRLG